MPYSNSSSLYKSEQWPEIRHSVELYSSKLSFSALDICYIQQHATFFTKSLMPENLTPAGADALINLLYETRPSQPQAWCFTIAAQGGPTSVVPEAPLAETSYAHRNSIYE
ncbi:hypothetical protein L207DRAFT_146378 [Hyaloscypha variabilis F]|uniref:Uncharacterized protein n=1 Tax=Hyaloscypha variabilis (strain UAMH 11265 / GT02V1 / F) TaxID=1149755 RepID=A0A2J6R5J2_HYAVF|nr:hypothetical protein L207DRAFT_146378 [Hyaloscypha variabilis F]